MPIKGFNDYDSVAKTIKLINITHAYLKASLN